jgi:hypothetical protein
MKTKLDLNSCGKGSVTRFYECLGKLEEGPGTAELTCLLSSPIATSVLQTINTL